ncbi:small subunit ribosomal protein S1 [Actinacidiphila alni]|uniref:Small subunit ribosomal protein S1 n=1 Tax=Actinacidiphila alni TaxID=380248 RepID=A0A1I1YJE6_9ACTN|nr:S1 RNA-binding domain-containing protein [Actinacidiphila alni]SFE19667.1 small subunit ribosomal protein S1 [Actinacidiphila alni]
MNEAADSQEVRDFLTGIRVGDVLGGSVAGISRRRDLAVLLDGFPARPLGTVFATDVSWLGSSAAAVEVGQRVTGEVVAVEADHGRVRLAMTATEHRELWAFLGARRPGEILSGTIASIETFGVFVALDDGPAHPVFPGVGFIAHPELSWRRFESASDVVRVGQRVACEFLQFDTWNGEARLSLKALRPDPFAAFAEACRVGRRLRGRVTKVVPFGVFVEVAEGVEGLMHRQEDGAAWLFDGAEPGDELTVVVIKVDRARRRLLLGADAGPGGDVNPGGDTGPGGDAGAVDGPVRTAAN